MFLTYSQLNINFLDDAKKLILEQIEKKGPKIIQSIIKDKNFIELQEIDKLKFNQLIDEYENNSIIPIENFNIPIELTDWFNTGCVETLIINGLSGMGKTELIKSFLKSQNIKFLLIRNVHGLKDYEPQIHKAVIFDDIFFEKELSSEEHIGISDTVNPSNIRILRDSIRIMQNTLRIFTTNDALNLLKNQNNNKAVLSRYFILNINKSLFRDDIEVDISIKIRNKDSENMVYQHNVNILKELELNKYTYNYNNDNLLQLTA